MSKLEERRREVEMYVEMKRLQYAAYRNDFPDPYEGAAKIASIVFDEVVWIDRQSPGVAIQLAVEQLQRHFCIERRESPSPLPEEGQLPLEGDKDVSQVDAQM